MVPVMANDATNVPPAISVSASIAVDGAIPTHSGSFTVTTSRLPHSWQSDINVGFRENNRPLAKIFIPSH